MSLRETSPEPAGLARVRAKLASQSGPQYWKSLEQAAETPEFQSALAAEFPSEADSWTDSASRRRFLHLMGASLALAGLSGCTRQPKEYILPYAANPPEATPGEVQHYATAMPFGGYGEPLLAESHMFRPTKLDGNPDHPLSGGASSVFAQASILEMYDPDRLRQPLNRGRAGSWASFEQEFGQQIALQRQKRGSGLRILSGPTSSTSLAAAIDQVRQALPEAQWHQWEPVNRDAATAAAQACFGGPVETIHQIEEATVILSLDADFLANTPDAVADLKGWARGRKLDDGAGKMNRLYVVEPAPTVTGTNADHRLRLQAGWVEAFAQALAVKLGVPGVDWPELPEHALAWIDPLAADLERAGATALVRVGDQQTPGVHALAHAIHAHLGAVGRTVSYAEPIAFEPVDQLASLEQLTGDMAAGQVDALLILGGNPSYDSPGDVDFAAALDAVAFRAMLTLGENETSRMCHWQLPQAHYLEAWGDLRGRDGSSIVQQPMIEPIFGGRSALELLALTAGDERSGYELVRESFAAGAGGSEEQEQTWRRALHDGVVAGSGVQPKTVALADGWTATLTRDRPDGLELVVRPDPTVWDGRFNNNGWMQELPKPVSKLTWENVAQVSPATAEQMGLRNGEVVELSTGGEKVRGPVWIVPGQADQVLAVHLGYGRQVTGRVGEGAGFSAYALQKASSRWASTGLSLAKRGTFSDVACVQDHNSMEGRQLVRHATAEEYGEHPDFAQRVGHHGPPAASGDHAEPGVGSPFVGEVGETGDQGPAPQVAFESGRSPGFGYSDAENEKSFFPEWNYTDYAWGMTIDLNQCVGCNACTAACGAENNIPVVGKEQVLKGREMHWIRIDRYFSGDLDSPATHYQPLTCMQCENAPCEPVCPVGATVHSSEGLNDMVYNRCVGTRYCANNCPYKVRRFNFLLYQDFESDTLKLGRNPDVTVRSRGIMEKCTYCTQRISQARITAEKEGRRIADGEIQTACQQVCPADAISFGDINDPGSRVAQLKGDPRNYGLLEELNTQPRTTYLARVRNVNPEMPDAHAGGDDGGEHAAVSGGLVQIATAQMATEA